MEQLNYIIKKPIYKHLNMEHYDVIQSDYNNFIFCKEKRIKKTDFMKQLAFKIGTSLSNLYEIINDGMISIRNYDYTYRKEFNALTAINKRKKKLTNNSSKLESANEFIQLIINDFKSDENINSIDEIINDLKLNRQDEIIGLKTICTKTFYNYVHTKKVDIKPIDLPDMLRRKQRVPRKEAKRQKGTSIEERPFKPDDRSIFGHWEGDLVVGSRSKDSGAVLTLVERMTRNQIVVKLKNRNSKQVYMAINKLELTYGSVFPLMFKSITFDNGSEFSRFKDIEKRPGNKRKRTAVYFAHPYSSWERGSNENGNKLLRRFLLKGHNINNYSNEYIANANNLINNKKRKILGYKSSKNLFNIELAKLTQYPITL